MDELQDTSTTLAPGPKNDNRFSGNLNACKFLPGIVARGSTRSEQAIQRRGERKGNLSYQLRWGILGPRVHSTRYEDLLFPTACWKELAFH